MTLRGRALYFVAGYRQVACLEWKPEFSGSYVHLTPADGIIDEKTRKFLQLSNLLLPYQSFALYTQEKIKQ